MIRLRRAGVLLASVAIIVLAATGAYEEIFSYFASSYDDEGLMMMSLRQVLDGHRLYDEVRVGYGPLYYLIKGVIHGPLGIPLTHDVVRLTATGWRLLAATVAATALWTLTRYVSLSVLGFLLVTVSTGFVRAEPGHPQEIVAVVLMALPVAAAAMSGRRALMACGCLGVLVAGMMMIKSNLGVFTGLAVWMALVSSMSPKLTTRTLWCASAASAVLLPILLLRGSMGEAWAVQLAGCAAAWIGAAAALSWPRRDGVRLVHLLVFAAAAAGAAIALLMPSILSGTSLTTLLECLVIGPRLLTKFARPFEVRWMLPAALVGLLSAILGALVSAARPRAAAMVHTYGLAKLAFAVAAIRIIWPPQPALLIAWLTPFAWLVLLPSSDEPWTPAQRFTRLLLVWLAVIEPLQVYPVHGSQLLLGSLVHVLCGVVCLADAATWARTLLPLSWQRPAQASATVATMALTLWFAVSWRNSMAAPYRSGVPLDLPGATRLRLPRQQADTLRRLVDTISQRCDATFAFPGFASLYFWSGRTPPTLDLITHQIRLVTPERQEAIVSVLARSERACFVRGPGFTLELDPDFERRMAALFGAGRQPRANLIQIGPYQVLTRITESSVS